MICTDVPFFFFHRQGLDILSITVFPILFMPSGIIITIIYLFFGQSVYCPFLPTHLYVGTERTKKNAL